MVRTRAKKGTSRQTATDDNAEGQSSEEWQLWLLDFEKEMNGRALKLKATLETELEALDRSLVMMLMQIPPHEADAPPARIDDSKDSIASLDDTLTSTMKKPGKGFVTSTALKPMPPPEPKCAEPKTGRQSRARTKRTRTSSLTDISSVIPDLSSTRRMTRSSSQPRDATHRFLTDYQTPMNKPNRTITAVTPKVDPYCPMPLKRHARQGELAISLTGSPLMTTVSASEPNICLPLNNGQEVYSILPTSGPCPQIPNIDSSTREKLMLLRENIGRILGE